MLSLYPCFNHYKQYQDIWIYSDPHFGDVQMKRARSHYIGDDEQVKRINSKVGKKDIIIFLGDIGDPSYIKKIRGYKVLVAGNHDRGKTYYEKSEENPYMFDEVYVGVVALNDKLLLSHEPVSLQFMFNIHGHDHSNKVSIDDGMHLNVCAEHIDYTPLNLNKIVAAGLCKDIPSIHHLAVDRAITKSEKHKEIKFDEKEWNFLYDGFSRWIFRMMGDNSLSSLKNRNDSLCYIGDKLIQFEKELYRDYFDKDPKATVPFEEYEALCNKYIHQAKEDGQDLAISFFFMRYSDYPKKYIDYLDLLKPATKQEIKQAREDFGYVVEILHNETSEHYHTFNDDAKVLEYRGLRLIIDNEWEDAWIKDEKGEIHHFQLIWDWNYLIDQYIAYHII